MTFRSIAQAYADAMLDHGRDHYGPEETPLFAAMLDRRTLSLVGSSVGALPEISGVRTMDRSWGGANPADHEQLYRLLYQLTDLTGEQRYAQAADSALAYFFRRTQHPESGFVAWGEHMAWDLRNEAPVDYGKHTAKYQYTHEMLKWHLWPKVFRLTPEAGVRFARGLWRDQVRDDGRFSRHAPYDGEGRPLKGGDFPRYGGNMILAWARAYTHVERAAVKHELITAIETVARGFNEHRSPASGGIPVAWSTCQWGSYRCRQYWGKSSLRLATEAGIAAELPLPDSTKRLLRETARRTDEVILALDHEPQGRGLLHRAHLETLEPGSGHPERGADVAYSTLWGQGGPLTAIYALQMLDRYEQTEIREYRTLALDAARVYLGSTPDRSGPLTPKALANPITLMLRAYRMTGEERFLEQASSFGKKAVTLFMSETSPLPKASTQYEHYEPITRGDNLMLAFLNLHAALEEADREDLSAARLPPVPFKVSGNYPNPFSQKTTIEYWLPKREKVTMQVYDILGRQVAAVQKGSEPKGHHEIGFKADPRLASGVYVYRLRAGSMSVTGRMVLAR